MSTTTKRPTGTPIYKGEQVIIIATNTYRPQVVNGTIITRPTTHLIRRPNGQEIRVPDSGLSFRCDSVTHRFAAPESAHPAPRSCLNERCDTVREGRTFAETVRG